MRDVFENQPGIPSFLFKKLIPLSRHMHGRLGLRPERTFQEYRFHWLPIVLSEVPVVAGKFPIVLAETQAPMLAIGVGLHHAQSLFIDRNGRWTGEYLPLYLRQMPFQIVQLRVDGAPPRPTICVDIDSPMVDECFEDKIIAMGAIGPACEDAVAAAQSFQREASATSALAQSLEQLGLAVPLKALPEGADCDALGNLRAVSNSRLREIGTDKLGQSAANDTLSLLHACIRSLGNVNRLRQVQEIRNAEEEAHVRADL